MKKIINSSLAFLLFLFLLTTVNPLISNSYLEEAYENKLVEKISITMENLPKGASFNKERVVSQLRTKKGDPFSQLSFDQDLKTLSEEYDKVEPNIEINGNEISIFIKLWQKPKIRGILWFGNKQIKSSKLQNKLGIEPHSTFNREEFNKAFTKVKDYYIKKGYFESELEYKLIPYPNTNEVEIQITVNEGHTGHISNISFSGLTKKEERAILEMMVTKKHNFFTSWATGKGKYHEEALDHDNLLIVNYLQNEGYADAKVNIQIEETKNGRLAVKIIAIKGEQFHFGDITISGNELFDENTVKKYLAIHNKQLFSPEKIRDSVQNIKDLYGKDGYIETDVQYTLHLLEEEPVYNVEFQIEEGDQFRIGLIRVLGNISTNNNVILRESLLVPGELFDSRRLKATQMRLESMGYFKSINVYAVKTPEDEESGENYRDVIIEVEETTTGSLSLFFGFSSIDDLFGGLDLAENNFNYKGFFSWWRDGLSSFRGAGEYAHARAQIGQRQQTYSVAWMNPYLMDTLWRFGVDVNYSINELQSDGYKTNIIGGSIFTNYPLTSYWTFGMKYRLKSSVFKWTGKTKNMLNSEIQLARQNAGIVTGFGPSLSYDSTDNAFKPHRGLRSFSEAEIAGARRRTTDPRVFPFFRISTSNNYYYPIWRKGTVKLRLELKFLYPFAEGAPKDVPESERFYLGGETTVRGYHPFNIGPKFTKIDGTPDLNKPRGGVSSLLASIEYMQTIFPMLDVFVFFDGGSVSDKDFDIPDFRMSSGLGVRIELANRVPITLGYGWPINKGPNLDKKFFFSMGGQF